MINRKFKAWVEDPSRSLMKSKHLMQVFFYFNFLNKIINKKLLFTWASVHDIKVELRIRMRSQKLCIILMWVVGLVKGEDEYGHYEQDNFQKTHVFKKRRQWISFKKKIAIHAQVSIVTPHFYCYQPKIIIFETRKLGTNSIKTNWDLIFISNLS